MGSVSICLSSASILRCHSLTRIQNICLIIPTALEIIFSTSLVFVQRGPGKWVGKSIPSLPSCWLVYRRNVLLTAEGLSFLTLVVLELLSNTLPAVRGNLHLFEAVDLAIGESNRLYFFYTRTQPSTISRHCLSFTNLLLHHLSLSSNNHRGPPVTPTAH